MSFPASLTTRMVKGRFVTYPAGEPAKGKVRIVLNDFMQGPTDDAFVAPIDETFKLDSNGEFSALLPATNDPQWTHSYYKVTITIGEKVVRDRFILPYNDTSDFNLADNLNLPSSTPGEQYILVAAKGAPGGVASLGTDGKIIPGQIPLSIAATLDWEDVTNKPTAFPHDEVTYGQVTGKPTEFPPSAHVHPYDQITNKPTEFPPSVHEHQMTDVNGLGSALAAKADGSALASGLATKANTVHTHTTAQVTGLDTALAGKANAAHGHVQTDVAGLSAALAAKADASTTTSALATKADASAVTAALSNKADLVGGVLASSQVPSIAVVEFLGSVSTQTAMLALNGQKGDWCIRTDRGDTWQITGTNPTQISSWTNIPLGVSPVQTVNGQVGTVVLTKSDIGLANVDNTPDTSKPISTAQQAALNTKAPLDSPTFTGTVGGITKAMVGLGNVTNTADPDKPISTAAAEALALKLSKDQLGVFNTDFFTGIDKTGATNSTAGLQAAIVAAEASNALFRTLQIAKGVYKTDDTLMIQGTTGLRILGYGATIKPTLTAGKAAIEMKTTSANWMMGRQTVIEGLELNSASLGVGVGIYVNQAQEWYLHNVRVWYFDTALKLGDTWYGGVGGHSVFIGNTIGVDIVTNEVNTIDLHNLKINGAGKLAGPTSIGIRTVAQMYLIKFSGVTIEAYDYGFVNLRTTQGVGLFKFDEVYFEAITTCAIDFSQKDHLASVNVEMTNLHFSSDNKAAWIKLGSGSYTFHNSDFKSNRILIRNDSSYRVSLTTDVSTSQIDFTNTLANNIADGMVEINSGLERFADSNGYRYNTKGDYNVFPTPSSHLPSIIDSKAVMAISPLGSNQVGKFFPMLSVTHRPQVFEKGGVVLKSPGGNYFMLTVDDAGSVTTRDVTLMKAGFAPSLSAFPMIEVARRELRGSTYSLVAEGTSIHIPELNNRKITKTAGILVDSGTSTRTVGTTLEAVVTTPGASFYSPFFWDTDIEYFYCWQGSYWGWCGNDVTERTNLRAIGTLAQRPATPAVAFMRYYATDNTTRYTWNGTAWS